MDQTEALDRVAAALRERDALVRAVASGSRRGVANPWRRAEIRYVDLKPGRRLQVVRYDERQAHTQNYADVDAAVAELLATGFNAWHVTTTSRVLQLRFTKKGAPLLHESATSAEQDLAHDRAKQHLLAEDHPVFRALGLADESGRIKPSRRDKFRQVQEFCGALAAALDDGFAAGALPTDRPLVVADLGCGNAYLTFAADALLAARGVDARLVGVDVKEQSREHNTAVAAGLGVADRMSFVVGTIGDVTLDPAPDVVLALHACDTATDDALARAVEWGSGLVLAAPCCHHDVARQLRSAAAPAGYELLVRDGILRERFADTLTDGLRAGLLRQRGYRVDVTDFVDSAHTPRNTLLRAVRTGRAAAPDEVSAYADLVSTWHLRPALAERLNRNCRFGDPLAAGLING